MLATCFDSCRPRKSFFLYIYNNKINRGSTTNKDHEKSLKPAIKSSASAYTDIKEGEP